MEDIKSLKDIIQHIKNSDPKVEIETSKESEDESNNVILFFGSSPMDVLGYNTIDSFDITEYECKYLTQLSKRILYFDTDAKIEKEDDKKLKIEKLKVYALANVDQFWNFSSYITYLFNKKIISEVIPTYTIHSKIKEEKNNRQPRIITGVVSEIVIKDVKQFERANKLLDDAFDIGTIKLPQSIYKCECCKKQGFGYQKCSACKDVYYCSKNCQVINWKNHKLSCKKKN